jgi:hypothetical protein
MKAAILKTLRSLVTICTLVIFLFPLQPATAQHLAAPFSDRLPSEMYLASLLPENGSSGVAGRERSLLFAPPPIDEEDGDGGGAGVGEAPVRECLWALVFCCLAYGIYCRKKMSEP